MQRASRLHCFVGFESAVRICSSNSSTSIGTSRGEEVTSASLSAFGDADATTIVGLAIPVEYVEHGGRD